MEEQRQSFKCPLVQHDACHFPRAVVAAKLRAHGIHHSVVHRETQSNFGVVLSLWDRLHRTLRLNVPQQQVEIGVPAYPDAAAQTVHHLLTMPADPLHPWARPDGSIPNRPLPTAPLDELAG